MEKNEKLSAVAWLRGFSAGVNTRTSRGSCMGVFSNPRATQEILVAVIRLKMDRTLKYLNTLPAISLRRC